MDDAPPSDLASNPLWEHRGMLAGYDHVAQNGVCRGFGSDSLSAAFLRRIRGELQLPKAQFDAYVVQIRQYNSGDNT